MPITSRLNVFQRLVRYWDKLHPYNAAQVLRIDGDPPPDFAHAWVEAVAELGLGKVVLNGRSFHYQRMAPDDPAGQPRVLPPGTDLEQHISAELNEPFGRSGVFPFRAFVLRDGRTWYAGVVYQHWIADSVSIRVLLREWFVRMYDPARARRRPLRQPHAGYIKLFGPNDANWSLGEGLLSSIRWSSRFKRVRRIEEPNWGDYRVKFSLHRLPDGWVNALHSAARGRRMTVNDLFLAAIAVACDQFVPVIPTERRQDLALGTIVDLRRYVRSDLSDLFGMFLGFTSVILRPQHLDDWETLLRVVATQGELHKRTGVPQASPIRMAAGVIAHKVLDRKQVGNFYRKRVPLAAGISNVNLNRDWAAEYHPGPLLDYIRVSPTGPMMPLVFTTTTLGRQFHFGLTRRTSVVGDERVAAIVQTFLDRLNGELPVRLAEAAGTHTDVAGAIRARA